MATTDTTLASAATASATLITLTAYTAPADLGPGQHVLLLIDAEMMLVTSTALSPTLQVVRGYNKTIAAAHTIYAGVTYGNTLDFTQDPGPTIGPRAQVYSIQEITSTGATGTTAAILDVPAPALITVGTGASGAGINLPVPVVGMAYQIYNGSSGALVLYCLGGTLNGVTGTTGTTITTTGNKMAWAQCTTAGVWRVGGNT